MTGQLVLSKDWGLQTLTWRAFVRDHRQRLTFVGALIVFLTFISKEVLREHWAGLASSIEETENILNAMTGVAGSTMYRPSRLSGVRIRILIPETGEP
jgi:hypothetical protein